MSVLRVPLPASVLVEPGAFAPLASEVTFPIRPSTWKSPKIRDAPALTKVLLTEI